MTSLWPVRQLATSTPHCSGWTPSIGPSLPSSSSENIPFLVLSTCIMCPQTAPEVTSASLNDSTGGLKSRTPSSLLMVGFTGPLRLHAQINGAHNSTLDIFVPGSYVSVISQQYYSSSICACVFVCSTKAALADPELDKPRCEQQQHPEVGLRCSGGSSPGDHVVQKRRSPKAKPR